MDKRVYFTHMGATLSQPIPTSFGWTSSEVADVTNSATFHVDRLRGFAFTDTRTSHVPIGKQGRPK
jgi:hypothetical protein